jgi:integrase
MKTLPAIGLENITPHDLRRTAASNMTALGISRLVASKILNHVETGVTAVCNRHGYDAEKCHALEAWSARLEEIVSGKPATSNVVPLATVGEAK